MAEPRASLSSQRVEYLQYTDAAATSTTGRIHNLLVTSLWLTRGGIVSLRSLTARSANARSCAD